jgi:hypothetical protein
MLGEFLEYQIIKEHCWTIRAKRKEEKKKSEINKKKNCKVRC